MARALYLLCYDVSEPRRLRNVFRLASGFRVAGQKSALECWLTPSERQDLLACLARAIDAHADRVHLFALDPRASIRCFGLAQSFTGPPFLVT